MSYHVYLFAKRTRTDNESSANRDWLENSANLTPLSTSERDTLAQRLSLDGFAPGPTDGEVQTFDHDAFGASARLTERGLYLSATGDGVFEIGMLASEVAGDGETFAKYDPQDGSWEP